jgi:hypothetical protein
MRVRIQIKAFSATENQNITQVLQIVPTPPTFKTTKLEEMSSAQRMRAEHPALQK